MVRESCGPKDAAILVPSRLDSRILRPTTDQEDGLRRRLAGVQGPDVAVAAEYAPGDVVTLGRGFDRAH